MYEKFPRWMVAEAIETDIGKARVSPLVIQRQVDKNIAQITPR